MCAKQSFQIMSLLSFLLSNEIYGQWLPVGGPSNDPITYLTVKEAMLYAGTASGNIFVSSNNGANWSEADSGLTHAYVWTIIAGAANLFAATDSGVFVSTNNAALWSKITTGLPKTTVRSLASRSAYLFAGTDSGVYVSSNSGTDWAAANTGLTYRHVYSLAASGTNIIAGTAGGGLFLSSDDGAHWMSVSSVAGAAYIYVPRLFADDNNVYAAISWSLPVVASYAGIFGSSDHGASWRKLYAYGSIEGGGMDVIDLATSGHALFEAASFRSFMNPSINGVFMSSDSGKTWLSVSTGLIDSNVISLVVSGQYLFAGTSTSGIWKRPLSEMVTSVQRASLVRPTEYYLSQNYPNPFNPSTVISFQLPRNAYVTLRVFDILGNEVETLVDKDENAGIHTVTFDANMLPSGVYFCRLQAGTYVSTKRLLFLK